MAASRLRLRYPARQFPVLAELPVFEIREFVNADEIASGLSPYDPCKADG
jgi:hypothetical protein